MDLQKTAVEDVFVISLNVIFSVEQYEKRSMPWMEKKSFQIYKYKELQIQKPVLPTKPGPEKKHLMHC